MKRPIVIWPDPLLTTVSRLVTVEELPGLLPLIEDMHETMVAADGVGLSAIQVGEALRIVVLDVGEGRETYINPEIISKGTTAKMTEGCLSLPGLFEQVSRSVDVICLYLDEVGQLNRANLTGKRAHALQHEIEHLDGKLLVDLVPGVTRRLARKHYEKALRAAKAANQTLSQYIYGW